MHPNVVRVRDALAAAGAPIDPVVLDTPARTAAEAAAALGVEVGQIANSLVLLADGEPVLVLASGAARVDPQVVARTLGATSVERPDAAAVREATGFPIGGVPPVGHTRPLRTLVDRSLSAYELVWAAAGHPNAVFETSYEQLLVVTRGDPADVR